MKPKSLDCASEPKRGHKRTPGKKRMQQYAEIIAAATFDCDYTALDAFMSSPDVAPELAGVIKDWGVTGVDAEDIMQVWNDHKDKLRELAEYECCERMCFGFEEYATKAPPEAREVSEKEAKEFRTSVFAELKQWIDGGRRTGGSAEEAPSDTGPEDSDMSQLSDEIPQQPLESDTGESSDESAAQLLVAETLETSDTKHLDSENGESSETSDDNAPLPAGERSETSEPHPLPDAIPDAWYRQIVQIVRTELEAALTQHPQFQTRQTSQTTVKELPPPPPKTEKVKGIRTRKRGNRVKYGGVIDGRLYDLIEQWRNDRGLNVSQALETAIWHFLDRPPLSFEADE